MERGRLAAQRFIGGVYGGQRIGGTNARLKAGLPEARLQPEALRRRVRLRQSGPVRLVNLGRLLAQRRKLRIEPACAAEHFK